MVEEFPGNSHKSKEPQEEEKKIKRVVEGDVKRRKEPLGRRFVKTFVGDDDARGVLDYILRDVLVPAAKDMISDAFSQGIERMLFGEARSRSSSRRSNDRHVNYNRISSVPVGRGDRYSPDRREERGSRSSHSVDQIFFSLRAEAQEVLESMYEYLSKYEVVSVSNYYEMVGEQSNFVDDKWGWDTLQGSQVVRARGGDYTIYLPRPIPLNN